MAEKAAVATEKAAPKKPKMVKIKLPLTRYEKDDVYVAINGKSYLIKRGEPVEVPEAVVEVLDNKERMLAVAYAFEEVASAKNDAKELK